MAVIGGPISQGWRNFALVFGAGFVLEPIRILWAVPCFGARMAELIETLIMLVVTVVAGRWIVERTIQKRRFACCRPHPRVGT
jgi:hypothetical protein